MPVPAHLVGAHFWSVSIHAAVVALRDLLERAVESRQLTQLQLLVLVVVVI